MNKDILNRIVELNVEVIKAMEESHKEIKSIDTSRYEISYKQERKAQIGAGLKDHLTNVFDKALIGLMVDKNSHIERYANTELKDADYTRINNIINLCGGKPSKLLLDKLAGYKNSEVLKMFGTRFDADSEEYKMINDKIEVMEHPGAAIEYLIKELPSVGVMAQIQADSLISLQDETAINTIKDYMKDFSTNLPKEKTE